MKSKREEAEKNLAEKKCLHRRFNEGKNQRNKAKRDDSSCSLRVVKEKRYQGIRVETGDENFEETRRIRVSHCYILEIVGAVREKIDLQRKKV